MILAFDTSGPHIAASLSDGGVPIETISKPMARGQAEALMPALQALLSAQDLSWTDLAAIGVGIGPGNFTGIRISVSAARGLGLALDIPVIGLSAFALRRDLSEPNATGDELVTLAAPRGQVYGQLFRDGEPRDAPLVFDPSDPPQHLRGVDLRVTGDQASAIAERLGGTAGVASEDDLPGRMAKLTEWYLARGGTHPAPAPLYVRPADAAPPREAAPVILS